MRAADGNPQVSVVMAVHNGEQYLPEAIESVLVQSFRDFEFIVIDDGSSDGSRRIIDEYARRDRRMRVVLQENLGLTRALNQGVEMARGEFIARMDADDVSVFERFQRQVQFLAGNPEYVVVGSEVLQIDDDGRPLCIRGHHQDHAAIDRQCLLGNGGAMTHPVVMIRKAALDQVGPYDGEFTTAQDLDLYLRLAEIGRLHNLRDVLLKWRQHPDSINRTRSATWPAMKRRAVGGAIRRRGVERYLAGVFPDATPGFYGEYDEQCLAMAACGGNFATGTKHLGTILRRRSPTAKELRACFFLALRATKSLLRRGVRS